MAIVKWSAMDAKAFLLTIIVFSSYISHTFGAVVNSKHNIIQSNDSVKKSPHDKTWKRSTDQEKSEYYDEYDYHEPEEPECPDGHFYHIRGLMCVPFDCPGGNQFRNKHTGECILRKYGVTETERSRPLRGLK
ncbi:unnamed protein product [Orchesella dallaii]|uniref:Uncharacterized protein n=1 Tax=Orchesella dallaii TaxID=48710 RepID=A0ABP1Q970_9HEXA